MHQFADAGMGKIHTEEGVAGVEMGFASPSRAFCDLYDAGFVPLALAEAFSYYPSLAELVSGRTILCRESVVYVPHKKPVFAPELLNASLAEAMAHAHAQGRECYLSLSERVVGESFPDYGVTVLTRALYGKSEGASRVHRLLLQEGVKGIVIQTLNASYVNDARHHNKPFVRPVVFGFSDGQWGVFGTKWSDQHPARGLREI